jgi:hypothetical protein
MSLELCDIEDRDCRLTRTEMWRIALLALGGVLLFIGVGAAELLLMHWPGSGGKWRPLHRIAGMAPEVFEAAKRVISAV